jgi:hypothetical protein
VEPPSRKIQLITVSREYGAGGTDLAALLGKRLGWPTHTDGRNDSGAAR